ncbi:uncharacterized protein LOC125042785 [Penaeus chinensis]|uniref:uncharacterized protein LOC125042785 n=1 Tax=Penaeus chinensis TaxID=139456 RepID=UPI001FB7DBAE|nr:uncharacterized protein LOC125042785 [Penaeus chinensis]XP_047494629.1 uncharacterized protein LOC125042785 [Penaeus chinensis]
MGGEDGSGPRGFSILGANTVRILLGTLVAFIALVLVSLVVFWYQGCPKGGFRCRDGACLPRNRWCDNATDCLDGEDESAENCLLPPGQSPELIMELLDSMRKCDLCVCPRWSSLANCEPQPKDNTSIGECKTRHDVLPRPFPRPFFRNPRSDRPLTSPANHFAAHAPPTKEGELGDFDDKREHKSSRSRVGRQPAGPSSSGLRRRRGYPEGEIGLRTVWKFDLPRVMHFKALRSFNDVEDSQNKEYGDMATKPTRRNKNKIYEGLTRTRKFATQDTASSQKLTSDPLACDTPFVDTALCGGVLQDETDARHSISGTGPLGSLSVSHAFPTNTGIPSNNNINKTTFKNMIHKLPQILKTTPPKSIHTLEASASSPTALNEVGKAISRAGLNSQKFEHGKKRITEKNETGFAEKQNSVRFDPAGGSCPPWSRLCRPKKRERRYLSSGVPQMAHGHVGARSNLKPFPKRRLEDSLYNILLRRGQGTALPPLKDLEGPLILNMRRVEHHNETRSAYDAEEVVDPEINDCFCEYSSQLKCLGKRITRIPSGVVGNVTWFIVRMSSVRHLDIDVMAQYPSLRIMSLEENHLTSIPRGVFFNQNVLKHLYMSKNHIKYLHKDSCQGLRSLLTFFLDKNGLEFAELSCFMHTPSLVTLNLAYNRLSLRRQRFPPLPGLRHVFLHDNKIANIDNLFTNITSITTLQLNNNRIRVIRCQAFSALQHLRSVDLSGNPLTTVQDIFTGLKALRVLNLMDLELQDIDERHFLSMVELKLAYFKTFRYCSYVPRVLQCLPSTDGVSNGRDMMGWVVLRAAVWVVAALTLAGNLAVIGCRAISKEDNKILKLFIKNLAAADLLMGVYLVILGVQDLKTRGSFREEALAWASSYTCTFTGILGLVSSETSVFILTFMSLERYLFIRQPLEARTLSERSARVCLFFIWLTSVFLAVFPAIWIKSFYESGAMCIPLHVTEPYLAGWQYSAFIFLGINTLSMAVILGAYAGLFFNIMVTRTSTPLSGGESRFALRFFFIVITNCVCWLPIACVKAAALANIEVHSGVYAWLVVLVLPINSAINPILYTFSTSKFQSQMSTLRSVFRAARNRQDSATDTDVLRYSSSRSWGSTAQYIVNHAHLPPLRAHNGSQNGPAVLIRERVDRRASAHGFCQRRSTCDSSCGLKDPLAKDAPSSNGIASPEKDLSPGRHLTLSAKVSQVRSASLRERANDVSTSPGSRGRLPLFKLELGGRRTPPSTEASCREAEGEHTPADGQEYKDICLEAHLSSHKTPQPREIIAPPESSSNVEGAPIYVGCCATSSSDNQNADVLRLNLTLCYNSDATQPPRRTSSSSGIRRNSDTKYSLPSARAKTTSAAHTVPETNQTPWHSPFPIVTSLAPLPRRSSWSEFSSSVSASRD